jgi:iron(III) transport system permease protein
VVQRWRVPGARGLDALAMAPLAIPGVVMALGFFSLGTYAAAQWPALRGVLDPFANPTLLLVVAYAVRRLPQALRSVSAGLSQVPVELEEAAAACGAGPWQRLRRIILPLIAGALAAGGILAFSFAMLEVADSLVLAQQRAYWPITKVIFDLINVLGQGPALACAFGVWAMLFLAASLAAAAAAVGKPLGDVLRDR